MTAWRTLNKAHTVLMADPSSQPLAREVLSTMLKLEKLAERQQRKVEKQKKGASGLLSKRW